MNRKILLLIIVLIVGGVAYWQYQRYLEQPENKIPAIVNHTSIRLSKALSYEMKDSAEQSNVNYASIFSSLDNCMAEINQDIAEMQKMDALKISSRGRLHEATLYVQRSQKVIKAEYDKYLKQQDYNEALRGVRIGDTGLTVRENVNTREIEYKKSKEEFATALRELAEASDSMAKFIAKENLVDRQLIEKIIGKNQED